MPPAQTAIASPHAPAAIGPYSQAIAIEGLVFCSGQLGLDPLSGQMVTGGVVAETRRALDNLKAVLAAADSSLDRVVRTSVYLVDLGEFQTMNAIYAEYFPNCPPARSTVQVAALPRGARVEIDAIALRG
jgi:2-iminobutanoate/2-iminopropanoate deaminase